MVLMVVNLAEPELQSLSWWAGEENRARTLGKGRSNWRRGRLQVVNAALMV